VKQDGGVIRERLGGTGLGRKCEVGPVPRLPERMHNLRINGENLEGMCTSGDSNLRRLFPRFSAINV